MMSNAARLVPSLLFALALFLFALAERYAGPLEVVTYWVYGGIVSLLFSPFMVMEERRARRSAVVSALGFCLTLAVIWVLPFGINEPFVRAFERIRPGMSVAEVERIMRPYPRRMNLGEGMLKGSLPAIERGSVYYDPDNNTGAINYAPVEFRQGRVVRAVISWD
jgi:hypothetical protein